MLVHATGAPALSAASSGGSLVSQCTARNRRPVTFPAASETSQTRGGAMTSGWISSARLNPASPEIIRVLVAPPGTRALTVTPLPFKVLRHDRAERLDRGFGGPVSRRAGIQHRAEARRDVDNPVPTLPHSCPVRRHSSASMAPLCALRRRGATDPA